MVPLPMLPLPPPKRFKIFPSPPPAAAAAAAAAAVEETNDDGRTELLLLLTLLCVAEIAEEGRDTDDVGRRDTANGCVKTFFPTNFLGPAAFATTFVVPLLLKFFLLPSFPFPLMVVFF